jgi:uncharacterized protein (TIGR00251 family)
VDPWVKRLKIKVTESPIKGKANRELVKKLSALLGGYVEIVKGATASKKTLLIKTDRKTLKEGLGI